MYLSSEKQFITSNGVTCIDVSWFQDVGIVIAQDRVTLEYKAYVKSIATDKHGSRKGNFGGPEAWLNNQEDKDIGFIMAYGAKFPANNAKLLFPQYEFIEGDFFEEIVDKYPEHFI